MTHALLANIAMTRAGYAIREQAKEGYITGNNSDATLSNSTLQ